MRALALALLLLCLGPAMALASSPLESGEAATAQAAELSAPRGRDAHYRVRQDPAEQYFEGGGWISYPSCDSVLT